MGRGNAPQPRNGFRDSFKFPRSSRVDQEPSLFPAEHPSHEQVQAKRCKGDGDDLSSKRRDGSAAQPITLPSPGQSCISTAAVRSVVDVEAFRCLFLLSLRRRRRRRLLPSCFIYNHTLFALWFTCIFTEIKLFLLFVFCYRFACLRFHFPVAVLLTFPPPQHIHIREKDTPC